MLPTDWAAAQNGRGLANVHFCFRHEEATGERAPRAALEMRRRTAAARQWRPKKDVSPTQWANLGYLLVHRGRSEGGEGGMEWLRRAVDECRGAQEALVRRSRRTCSW